MGRDHGRQGSSDGLLDGFLVDPEAGEHACAFFEFEEGEEDVFGSDIVVAKAQCLTAGEFQGLASTRAERDQVRHLLGGRCSFVVTVRRSVSSATPWTVIALAARASGWVRSPSARCSGAISGLRAARASF